jgi:hypothetical protein
MIMERAQALTRLIHDPAPRADRLSLCDPVLRPCYSPVSGGVGGWGWILWSSALSSTSGTGSAEV